MDEDGTRAHVQRAEWGRLFVEHRRSVLATCQAMLRHPEQAEDAAQEVFARVPMSGGRVSDARPWLLEVARNVCIDTLRHRQRHPATALDSVAEIVHVYNLERAACQRLFAAWILAQLPTRERRVLARQVILDEPLETVAHRLGMSYAMAAKLASRAKRRAAALATEATREPTADCNETTRAGSPRFMVYGARKGAAIADDIAEEHECAVA